MYGEPRKLPPPCATKSTVATTSLSKHSLSPIFGYGMYLGLLILLLLFFPPLSAYFGTLKMAASRSTKEKFENLSIVDPIL